MNRTWKDNADEFAALDQGEGWPFAILIACSVEKGKGHGGSAHRRDHDDAEKVGAREFAERVGTSADRVLRYLKAWERAAADGVVPDADTLSPADSHDVPTPDERFGGKYVPGEGGYYDGTAQGGGLVTERVQATPASTLVDKMTPEQRIEVARTIIKVVPDAEVATIADHAYEREAADRELRAVANGAQPVSPLPTFQPGTDALDGLMEGGMAEADLLDAMERVVVLARRVGNLASDHPTALRLQTMWMDVASHFVVVNSDAHRN
jgi:hypothetical protein